MAKQRVKSLTQPMYYILLSLKKKRHGYEIMQYVSWLTDGRVKIGPGTLYSLLGRFEESQYIEMVADSDNKKTYIITNLGDEVLADEMKRLEGLLKDGNRILRGRDDEFENR